MSNSERHWLPQEHEQLLPMYSSFQNNDGLVMSRQTTKS